MDILTGNVGGDVAADGVTETGRTVGVELAALVAILDVQAGKVTVALNLDVKGRLDEMRRGDGAVGDDTRVVSRLKAPRDLELLGFADDRVGLRRRKDAATPIVRTRNTKEAEGGRSLIHSQVVDAVEGQQTRVRGLVDRRARSSLGRVGVTHGASGGDLGVGLDRR